ncbi:MULTISPECIES: hypothetical protein [Hyphobacterium]|uniref:Mu-like prophage FluMu N-terminal domain-containing protein n=1 Tax=Hyphobacterium vulgare TaxID=1736751 RepID=A0ABV6ZU62_9PROT
MKTLIKNGSNERRAFKTAKGMVIPEPGESREVDGLSLTAPTRKELESIGYEFVTASTAEPTDTAAPASDPAKKAGKAEK